jgi:FdhD protein
MPPADPEPSAVPAAVTRVGGDDPRTGPDLVAVEEPLEIRLGHGPAADRSRAVVSVTMRTPGHDAELAVGFLHTEGVLVSADDYLAAEQPSPNVIRVDLRPGVSVDLGRLERHVYTTSSCGVCGKTSLDAVEVRCDPLPAGGPVVPAGAIHALPRRLREAQPAFDRTGGLHAAALFDSTGGLLVAREDVGRHNAVDKVIGREFLRGALPLHGHILFVSGRAGFELVQKAAVAGVPVFAAVGAPTSLAVELARRVGMTLVGFVRDGRFNVYAGAERIRLTTEAQSHREDRT